MSTNRNLFLKTSQPLLKKYFQSNPWPWQHFQSLSNAYCDISPIYGTNCYTLSYYYKGTFYLIIDWVLTFTVIYYFLEMLCMEVSLKGACSY